jgi:YqjK-like protein
MNRELARLAERRSQLVARAASQRIALAHAVEPWRPRLALVDQGIAVLRYIGRHPALIVGAVLLFAVWRPRGAGRWLRRGWVVWQLGRSLRKS